jgi:type IV pilus assembly protein PilB
MRVSDITIEKIITQAGLVNESKLTDLKNEAENSAQPLQDVVLHQRLASDDTLTKMIGDYIGVPFVQIDPKDISEELLLKIPEHIARQYNAVLFAASEDGVLSLAMDDPDDVQALSFIQKEIDEGTLQSGAFSFIYREACTCYFNT